MDDVSSSIVHRRRLPPLAALRAFEAAARHLSFRRAADELAVTPTAISHQIRLLEETLGRPLFTRHVRRVALTEAGLQLYPTLRDGFDAFEKAVASLSPTTRRKAVTVTATTLITVRRLLPGLGAFRVRNPTMDLRLHASDELVDLGSGLAEIAVRYGSGPFDGLVTEPLLAERFGVLCSPTLNLSHRDQLKRSTLLHTEWKRTEKAPDWRRWFRLAGMIDIPSDEGPRFMEDDHALQAAIAGHGVVIGSLVLAKSEIEAGFLVNPFGPLIEGEIYHVAATPENMACADVQAVRDWLRETVA